MIKIYLNHIFIFDKWYDSLNTTATLANAKPLPAWLSFSPATISFTGLPKPGDNGDFAILITAQDNISPGNAQVMFNLKIDYNPEVNRAIPPQRAVINSFYILPLHNDTFGDKDGDKLAYSAAFRNGSALPTWLTFKNSNLTFMGTPQPKDAGSLSLQVQASDPYDGHAFLYFDLLVDSREKLKPSVIGALETIPDAPIHHVYNYSLDMTKLFKDKYDQPLSFFAQLSDGRHLPFWLTFRPTIDEERYLFSGEPGRGDLNIFGNKELSMVIIAENIDKLKAELPCRLTVTGRSYGEILVKFGSPIATGMSVGLALYKNRVRIINQYRKWRNIYQREGIIISGDPILLSTPPTKIASIQALLWRDHKKIWESVYQKLPAGRQLPSWLLYDTSTNCLIPDMSRVPDVEDITIRVCDGHGIIREEFSISTYENSEKGSDNDEQHIEDDPPMHDSALDED